LALAAFERSQRADPNRFRNLYGAARSAELVGDRERAGTFYAHLLEQSDPRSADRDEIEHARVFMAKSARKR
jgi:hypothetical protein